MYRYFYSIFFFTLTFFSYGQNCLPSGITFSSQADVDAFPSSHPNCSEIDGDVLIGKNCGDTPSDINNLDSLIQLLYIHGNFTISLNPNLTDLAGLESLISVDNHLIIICNDNINDLSGISNLISSGSFEVSNCPSLNSLTGLNNLSNFNVPSSSGNWISIFQNSSLSDISALTQLDTTGLDDLEIANNPMLSDCAIQLVCNFIDSNTANSYIDNNLTGCNSIAEVEIACSILPVIYSKELSAYKNNENVILKFSVAQQVNNSYFEVQHSIYGEKFKTIGEIQGAWTASKEIAYEYIHSSPKQGINYYRIKQMDFDDNFSYSNITSIRFKDERILINSNPVFNEIIVNGINESQPFIIFSTLGEIVLQGILEDGSRINVSYLDKGLYIIKIHNLPAKKFIKM